MPPTHLDGDKLPIDARARQLHCAKGAVTHCAPDAVVLRQVGGPAEFRAIVGVLSCLIPCRGGALPPSEQRRQLQTKLPWLAAGADTFANACRWTCTSRPQATEHNTTDCDGDLETFWRNQLGMPKVQRHADQNGEVTEQDGIRPGAGAVTTRRKLPPKRYDRGEPALSCSATLQAAARPRGSEQ